MKVVARTLLHLATMTYSFCLLLASILVARSSADEPSIPTLPNFLNGFTETITNVSGSEISVAVSRVSRLASLAEIAGGR